MAELIPYQTILSAKAGDPEAIESIMRHYDKYIAYYSKRSYYDKYGNRYELVDQEIKQRIEARMMVLIIEKFDPTQMPPGETIEY